MTDLHARADVLRALHVPGRPLLLPNAWDAASARQVAAAGLPAVATSSAAVAESLGWADGEAAPAQVVLDALARIAAAVEVPVTADMERGYGLRPAELVERLAEAGAVGCNLEDSLPGDGRLLDVEEQFDFLSAVRAAADAAGTGLVLNARIDTWLRPSDTTSEERLAQTVARARRYREAGADCVYPILLADRGTIRRLVAEADVPVNIIAQGPAADLRSLADLGVARISFGAQLFRAQQARLAEELDRLAADLG
ncbi:isocitrate lyase/phosphoenolpyruvate mutase family protein [Streptacidiphilus monticola]